MIMNGTELLSWERAARVEREMLGAGTCEQGHASSPEEGTGHSHLDEISV